MIEISNTALSEVLRLRSKAESPDTSALRLGIEAGGCSGWSYQLDFEPAPGTDDHVFDCGEIQVVVSPQSFPHLNGLVIDYTEDLMGGSFRFQNPHATANCSCGYSFSMT